jgi:hypothetical protein
MMLGRPDVIEAQTIRELYLVERVFEQRMLGFLGPGTGELMLVKTAELHGIAFSLK